MKYKAKQIDILDSLETWEEIRNMDISRPQVKGGPKGLNHILESAYSSCMKKRKDKTKCSKIAWGAAKKAGWSQDEKGKWQKKGAQKDA